METLKIEILNPKAKSILKGLADLKLINIKKEQNKTDFTSLIEKLRNQSDIPPDINNISSEVELVRKKRYEN